MFNRKPAAAQDATVGPRTAVAFKNLLSHATSAHERAQCAKLFISEPDVLGNELHGCAAELRQLLADVTAAENLAYSDYVMLYHLSNASLRLHDDQWALARQRLTCIRSIVDIFGIRSSVVAELVAAFAIQHKGLAPEERYTFFMEILPFTGRPAMHEEFVQLRNAFACNLIGGGAFSSGSMLPIMLTLQKQVDECSR